MIKMRREFGCVVHEVRRNDEPGSLISCDESLLRVLILVDSFGNVGGAELLAIAIATHLPPDRYKVYVCTTRSPPDDSLAAALAPTTVHHLDLARSGRFDLLAFRRLIGFLRHERIDILHAHKFGSNIWGTLFGRLCRVPVVIAHEHSWSYLGQPLRRLLDRLMISRFADAFVAVSNADRDRMIAIERIRPAKISVISTAYIPRAPTSDGDVREELGIGPGVPVVGALAVFRPQKALEVLIEAISLLPKRLSNVRLVLAGDGECRAALEAQVEALDLRGRVHFLGMRDDPDAIWRTFDVGAISSDFEGAPIAAIEAMTNGVPLVATSVGGIPELLEHDVSALLVPPRDPVAMAGALTALLDDPALRKRLADEGRRVSQTFSLERLIKATDDLYLRLLASARRGRAA
jgi:glycosyltransferase involved in cell wall biosynthesis